MIADIIRQRLVEDGAPFAANDNIALHIKPGELDTLEHEVAAAIRHLLGVLVIDPDHNTTDTPARVARMFLREVYAGRYMPRPDVTDFPNAKALDEVYTVGPVTVRSACSHHLVPIMGQAWLGVIPGSRVIGLSKFARLTDWIMSRPQIQEEAAVQLADEIETLIQPRALAVVLKAQHQCMIWRGVRETSTSMTTSVMRGIFRADAAARNEFLTIIKGQGYA
jgi:GTP cyclohydrolase I